MFRVCLVCAVGPIYNIPNMAPEVDWVDDFVESAFRPVAFHGEDIYRRLEQCTMLTSKILALF